MEIKVQMSSDGIWGSDPENTVGLDVTASVAKLLEMVQRQVQLDYPDAAVEVELTLNDSVEVNGDVGGLDAETVAETVHNVWQHWEWTVARAVRNGNPRAPATYYVMVGTEMLSVPAVWCGPFATRVQAECAVGAAGIIQAAGGDWPDSVCTYEIMNRSDAFRHGLRLAANTWRVSNLLGMIVPRDRQHLWELQHERERV